MRLKDIINWDIFTQEEKIDIRKLVSSGHSTEITCIISTMTKEKEIEIQKIMDHVRPKEEGFISKVRDKYKSKTPETPEEEIEMQKELDDEFREHTKKQQRKEKKRIEKEEKITEKEEAPKSKTWFKK